ncbi:hypothetical protein LTR91_011576 [Friedmanniomyces endolithicus]|uniref:NIMA interactive protein n=1 Tax=Friedmanniomyces endolithicus TaxID=329885 RepID=A0AAN6KH09_9PEZI|nr:hypothetical protein LTR57_022244 [Friedmanniomyces endolithicus]KAK0982550.1 hypothetical protein LTR91_011576 [Friedmanniomyces endolithicus]KAK0998732.1 hypothetical protein LTS01_005559 [Friedmanniomyces endolithicus]KAK1033361.1 hypothetical protein LTS16_016355 [Friedmanniomyces endolithicus]KAK1070958.1 hypothetical protein LTR33_010540 [Friedmanniomyces endolithicus]
MDHESLRTAATYLNNLLLARGLLRNGEPVDFVKPSKDSRAQIINLVHDLILREDRGQEQRQHIAVTVRDLRAEDSRKTGEIEKLREKCEASARDAVQARAGERTAKEECKKVERAVKMLQDQTAKLKTSLAQVKTQCANDVRKRDLELARLKAHLQDQRRGNKTGLNAPSITISSAHARLRPAFDASVRELGDPEYKLKQETTEFLTQLSQNLSDENDSLIGLVRGAVETMEELLGITAHQQQQRHQHPDSAIGSLGSNNNGDIKPASTTTSQTQTLLQALPTSYESLASGLETALSHLKALLSNPNFVTVEEVEIREEEIGRLREGWERMEQMWRDVLRMMEGWRRRMGTGERIGLDDLRVGMGIVSPERGGGGGREGNGELEESIVNEDGSISAIQLPGMEEEGEGAEGASTLLLEAPPRLSSPSGAAAKSTARPKRKRDLLEPPAFFDLRPATSSRSAAASPRRGAVETYEEGEGLNELAGSVEEEEEDGGPQMTVRDKLAAAQAEAEETAAAAAATATAAPSRSAVRTRVHATQPDDDADPEPRRAPPPNFAIRDSPSRSAAKKMPFGLDGANDGMCDEEEQDDTLGKLASPMVKKTRIRERPKRWKSTLNPEELEELLRSAGE